MSGALDWALKEPVCIDNVLRVEISGFVRRLGLGVERNAESSLHRTSEELGSCLSIWAGGCEGMRKPGSFKDGDIDAKRKCVPNAQRNNLTTPLAYQLGESIVEISWMKRNKSPWTRSCCRSKIVK
jgi:hypothetical protein